MSTSVLHLHLSRPELRAAPWPDQGPRGEPLLRKGPRCPALEHPPVRSQVQLPQAQGPQVRTGPRPPQISRLQGVSSFCQCSSLRGEEPREGRHASFVLFGLVILWRLHSVVRAERTRQSHVKSRNHGPAVGTFSESVLHVRGVPEASSILQIDRYSSIGWVGNCEKCVASLLLE